MKRTTTARTLAGRTPALAAGLLAGSALLLTGCGGSAGDDSAAPAGAQAPVSGSTAKATPDPAAGGQGTVSAAEFCAAVQKAQPKLTKEGAEDAAFITLTLELANLYGQKNALETMDASSMDALAASCPGVAAAALKITGKKSFAEFR